MRLHRFYTGTELALEHYVTLKDERLLHQWQRVLRYRVGQQVILFDGAGHEALYGITELQKRSATLELITRLESAVPERQVYLLWSLLKKDKNDWVLQKCTELGVTHFVPLLAERSEKTGFHADRAQKIVTEAAEQCGRGDIPEVREPLLLQTALHEYGKHIPLLACEQYAKAAKKHPNYQEVGVLIGPEGGWSDAEKQLFATQEVGAIHLSNFTLRAETACVIAASDLL